MGGRVWIGVDGGGTHSTLAAVREDGTVLGYGSCGGLNFYASGMETVRERLSLAVSELLGSIGAEGYAMLSVGSAALDGRASEAQKQEFAGSVFPRDRLELCGDVFMAQCGACPGKPGVAVVSGTGAMVLGIDEKGTAHFAGGWGYLLGDPGSAYGTAVEALRSVFAAEEGLGPRSALRSKALAHFGAASVRDLIPQIYGDGCSPSDIADLAREVISLAENGDAEASRILKEQYRVLAKQTAIVLDACPGQVFLWGGMFGHSSYIRGLFRDLLLSERPDTAFGEPVFPPELGAVVWAMQSRGFLTQSILETIGSTWRDKK